MALVSPERQLRDTSDLIVSYRQMKFQRTPAMGVVSVKGVTQKATVFTPIKDGVTEKMQVRCGDDSVAARIIDAAGLIPRFIQDKIGYNCAWFAGRVVAPELITTDNCSRYIPSDWIFTDYTNTPGVKRMLPAFGEPGGPNEYSAGIGHWFIQLENGLGMHVNGHVNSPDGQGGYILLNYVDHIKELFPTAVCMYDASIPEAA